MKSMNYANIDVKRGQNIPEKCVDDVFLVHVIVVEVKSVRCLIQFL